jgi:hypothetical protein
MFGLFKNKKDRQASSNAPVLADLNNQPLQVGDLVESLRYDLGKCKLVTDEDGHILYESLESGKQVSWALMVDAATSLQKVRKISNEQ